MMYRFEINRIDNEHVGKEMLQTIENICEEFGMENDFGIISTAMQQLVDLIGAYTQDAPNHYSMVFTVDNQRLVSTVQQEIAMPAFEQSVLRADSDGAQILARLADSIECSEDGRQLGLEFEINPQQTPASQGSENLAQERQLAFLEKRIDVKINSESER